ncbi:site-specific DNA-methyltransferase [Moraxella catarrhalis]|uniref:site-specific DNA-methyltransferase n=1 Tax=Moraxella TaxID=475 RepID=UPI0007E3DFDF|nr:site-specific DNA-methyltransferase [Moraxella catarrhalis]STY81228.1 putative methyltransferase [Moraxella catarrhalis]
MDFDATQNIFIESDNLEVLKILQKSYAGKIKMIYIDPPYNTGNDFIYHDDFSQSKKDYEIATGDRDMNGQLLKSFKKNSKDNGHYHSNWLNMMLPRLHLAHTLLSDDGVIFISIDDNEQAQLKLLCDEIFGGENFVADFIWNNKYTVSNDTDVSYQHEHIVCFCKNRDIFELNLLPRTEKQNKSYKNRDNDPNGAWKPTPIHARSGSLNNIYEIEFPNGIKWTAPIGRYPRYSKDKLMELYYQEALYFNKNGGVDRKTYLSEVRQGVTCGTLWSYEDVGHSHGNNEEFSEIIGKGIFNDPKGTKLLKRIISLNSDKNSIILDFFAGSATTAHAVMQLNAEDNGNRQFIMVQLPELTDEKSEARKAGFKNIAEISKERIRRAGAKIKAENPDKNIDTGFKVFKLTDSNFKAWQIDDDIAKQLEMYIDPLKDNVNEMDIVYELLLKMGLKLTADIKFDNGVYWLTCENKSYAIVLNSLSQDEFHAIIVKKPAKTVVLDKAFLDDSEKSNIILQFKDAGLNFESI